ncbi:beta strand repeat-containing protein, partial [Sessilibacter corallicola]|uniref:beta strand repeat-containing protein n=1 Tax=Sessilibacter corallicola TaxID=2904075 RepID=UPI00333EA1A2
SVDLNNDNAAINAASDFTSNGIRYTNVNSATNTDTLTGTAGDDSFAQTDTNEVTVASIEFAGVNLVEGNGGVNDTVDLNSLGANLSASSFDSSGTVYSNVVLVTGTGSLLGTANDDNFAQTGNDQITVNGLEFSDVSAVDGNSGSNSVDLNSRNAVLNSSGFSANSISYANIASVTETAGLTGQAADDQFEFLSEQEIRVSGIEFSNVTSLDGGNGNDIIDANNLSIFLGASDFSVGVANRTSVTQVELVTNTGNLSGSGSSENFDLSGSSLVVDTLTSTEFQNVASIDGNGGTGSIDINDNNASLFVSGFTTDSGVNITDIDTVNNTGVLTGTANNDLFTETGNNSISASAIAFNGVNTVVGNNSSAGDEVSLRAGATVSIIDSNAFTSNSGIQFEGITTVTNAANIVGTAGDDSFTVEETGSQTTVTFENSVDFFDVESIDGGDGRDFVGLINGTINGDRSLISGLAENDIFTFNIEGASTIGGVAEGSSGQDTFTVTFNGTTIDVLVTQSGAEINVIGAESINGFDGDDTLVLDLSGSSVSTFDPELLVAAGFSIFDSFEVLNVEFVSNTGTLASAGNATFTVGGDNLLSVSGIQFSDTDSLFGAATDTLSVISQVNLVSGSSNLLSSNISFSGFTNVINVGSLIATDDNEAFNVTGNESINVSLAGTDVNFSGVTSVDNGLAGVDSVINNAGADVELSQTDSISVAGIDFSSVGSVDNTGTLLGTSGNDSFEINGTNSVSANNIDFSGVSFIEAGGGVSDSLVADGNVLLNSSGAIDFDASGIEVANVELVSNTGDLTGTDNSDSFVIEGTESVTFDNITFSDVQSLDALDGTDQISLSNSGALLSEQSGSDQFVSSQITVFNVENISNTGLLTGSSQAEVFNASIAQEVSVEGTNLIFSEVDSLDGSGGSDTLNIFDTAVSLSDSSQSFDFTAQDISVSGVESILQISGLTGSSESETFDVTGQNQILISTATGSNLTVEGAGSISGGTSDDDIVINTLASDVVLLNDNSVALGNFSFSEINTVNLTSALVGTQNDDQFIDLGTGTINAGNIIFNSVNQIDGSGGNDNFVIDDSNLTIVGGNGADSISGDGDWNITDASVSATGQVANVQFSEIESLVGDGNDATSLTGPNQSAVYNLESDGTGSFQVTGGNEISFSGINNINAGDGADQIVLAAGTVFGDIGGGAGNDVITLNSSSVGSVSGGLGDDQFNFSGSEFATISGGDGSDSISVASGDNIISVDSDFTGSLNGDVFDGIESIATGDGQDQVTVLAQITNVSTGAGDDVITVNGGTISGLLDAGAGSDNLQGSGILEIVTLSNLGSIDGSLNDSAISNFESFTSIGDSILSGSDQDSEYEWDSENNGAVSLTGGSEAFVFTGVNTLRAGSGVDSVTIGGEAREYTITNGDSTVGDSVFSGFENITDTTDGPIEITSSLAAVLESNSQLTLGTINFDYAGSLLTLIGAQSVTATDIVAENDFVLNDIVGDINLSGDFMSVTASVTGANSSITISETENGIILPSLVTAGGNVSVTAVNDISFDLIDTGTNNGSEVEVTSTVGSILPVFVGGESGDLNLIADTANFNAIFGAIGAQINAFNIDVTAEFSSASATFVPVIEINGRDTVNQDGVRTESFAQTAGNSGVRSATQNNLENAGNVDPAIFAELQPFGVGEDPVQLPEDQREEEFEEEYVELEEKDQLTLN